MLWWDDSPATRDRKHSSSAQAVITQSKTKILQCGTKNIKVLRDLNSFDIMPLCKYVTITDLRNRHAHTVLQAKK